MLNFLSFYIQPSPFLFAIYNFLLSSATFIKCVLSILRIVNPERLNLTVSAWVTKIHLKSCDLWPLWISMTIWFWLICFFLRNACSSWRQLRFHEQTFPFLLPGTTLKTFPGRNVFCIFTFYFFLFVFPLHKGIKLTYFIILNRKSIFLHLMKKL